MEYLPPDRPVDYRISEGVLKPVRIGSVFRFQPKDIDHLIGSGRSAVNVKPKKILAIGNDILARESIKTPPGRAAYLVPVAPADFFSRGVNDPRYTMLRKF